MRWTYAYCTPVTGAPAFPITLALDLDDNVHILRFEEVDRSKTNVFEICIARRDYVNHAENFAV